MQFLLKFLFTLRPTLCALLLSSLLLFQCSLGGLEEAAKDIVNTLENLAPSFGNQTIADQTYTQNREITTLTLPAATGGEPPLTYSLSPALPAGLSFDATAREITGTPTVAAAKKKYTYTATDANSFFADLTFMITVTIEDPVPPGLIPVSTLEQLNAIRYDLNGNGKVDHRGGLANIAAAETAYAAVFPKVAYDANNTGKYTGYKLENNLDFQEDASYSNATTNKTNFGGEGSGTGWAPIGVGSDAFTGTFDGQGKTISNLFINRGSTGNVGLFGDVGLGGSVQNVGLEDPVVTGTGNFVSVGGLVGDNGGRISACYVSGGTVTGSRDVGGLVGGNEGTISACYVLGGTVTGTGSVFGSVGGLVGNNDGTITVSYVSGGTVTGTGNFGIGGLVGLNDGPITASYVSGGTVTGSTVGSLVGWNTGTITACYTGGKNYAELVGTVFGTVTNSYHQLASGGTENATSKFEATLKAPTAYGTGASIYANWNVDVDGTAGADDPWDFGTNAQYPVLNGIDVDKDGDTDADDIAAQRN